MQRCSNCGSIASPARTPAVATGATPRDCWPMLAVRRKIVVRVGGKSPQASLRPHPGLPRRERIALGGVADSHHAIVQGLKKQLPPVAGPQRENASARRDLPSSARARERPHVHFIGPRLIRLIRQPTPVWGKRRVELGERRSQEQLRFPEPDSRAAPSRIAFDRRGENVIAAAVVIESGRFPSGENEYGTSVSLPSVRRCASPVRPSGSSTSREQPGWWTGTRCSSGRESTLAIDFRPGGNSAARECPGPDPSPRYPCPGH